MCLILLSFPTGDLGKSGWSDRVMTGEKEGKWEALIRSDAGEQNTSSLPQPGLMEPRCQGYESLWEEDRQEECSLPEAWLTEK